MRLAILAPRESIHTVRWCNALAARGHELHLLSVSTNGEQLAGGIKVHKLRVPSPLGYVMNAGQVRQLLNVLRPDLVHAHYASGYGTLGRLSGHHPYVLSVWGSDVYEFPERSSVHRRFLVANLRAADILCSTSEVMAHRTRSLLSTARVEVTPFGIDLEAFRPETRRDRDRITVGTVRNLRHKYGLDTLIGAFARAREEVLAREPAVGQALRLEIAGEGPLRASLEQLTTDLGIGPMTRFLGRVPHSEVPRLLNSWDIFVAPSRDDSESFGVAVLEASACGLPVVVSDAGGLPEVVIHEKTGLVVAREDVDATADAIVRLVRDPSLRLALGKTGHQHVKERYDWEHSVDRMEAVYQKVVSNHEG